MEYPGGPDAYMKDKQLREMLLAGNDIGEIAKTLGMHKRTVERRFNKVAGR